MSAATIKHVVISALLILAFGICITCCFDGMASCNEECSSDDDCDTGLICASNVCVPDDCGSCFNQNKSCSYNENTDDQEEGEMAECTFSYCY